MWLFVQRETEILGNPFHCSPGWPEKSLATIRGPSEGLIPHSVVTAWNFYSSEGKQRHSVNWLCFPKEKICILSLTDLYLISKDSISLHHLSINILQEQSVTPWKWGTEALVKFNLHTSTVCFARAFVPVILKLLASAIGEIGKEGCAEGGQM